MSKRGSKDVRDLLKKFWFIVWKDDSLKGWIFSLIFIFILIKFIIFPFLHLVTGTNIPLAIVESCSMYHKGNFFADFNSWWERHENKYSQYIINDLDFERFPFKNGFSKGDILFIVKPDIVNLKVGDVIVFNAGRKYPIIHRIIKIRVDSNGKRVFSTIGDNNWQQLPFEKEIPEDEILGKAVFRIVPYVGWGKLIFFEPFKPISERGLCSEN